jgi:hypothetical protein
MIILVSVDAGRGEPFIPVIGVFTACGLDAANDVPMVLERLEMARANLKAIAVHETQEDALDEQLNILDKLDLPLLNVPRGEGSCRGFARLSKPDFLERHWADVARRRMQPPVAVKGQRTHDLVPGCSACGKTQVSKPLDFEGAEQRPGHGITPAISLSAHRTAHVESLELALEITAGILACAVRMEDQT